MTRLSVAIVFLLGAVAGDAMERSATGPFVFHFDLANRQCLWNITELPTKTQRTLHTTSVCPEDVIFDFTSSVVHYRVRNKLFSGALSVPISASELPALPLDFEADGISANFTLGRLGVSGSGKDSAERWLQLNSSREWKRISGTDLRRPSPHSVIDLQGVLYSATCAVTKCDHTWSLVPKGALDKINASRIPSDNEGAGGVDRAFAKEDIARLAFGVDSALLYGWGLGDTAHARPPVYYCLKLCTEVVRLSIPPDWGHSGQISVSRMGAFALVAGEYDGRQGLVYRAGDARPYLNLEQSNHVAWLPDARLWDLSEPR